MSVAVTTVVKEFLQAVAIAAPPRPAIEWYTDVCVSQGWAQNEQAREWAERNQEKFLNALRVELSKSSANGRFSPFAFNSSSEYMLQGSAYIEPKDSEDVKEAKARRGRFAAYAELLKTLTPEEFEALCAGVLKLINVDDVRLTPHSSDQGIDFYGRLRLESALRQDVFPTVKKQLSVWMIGQAKHYQSTRVSTPDLRELVGSIELARARSYGSIVPQYEDLRVRVCDPVFYLFFTTGRISQDGWQLIDRSGIIAMDGEMVASFLAEHNVGICAGELNQAEFKMWLQLVD